MKVRLIAIKVYDWVTWSVATLIFICFIPILIFACWSIYFGWEARTWLISRVRAAGGLKLSRMRVRSRAGVTTDREGGESPI